MIIERKPSTYNFAGNIPDLVIAGVTEPIPFTLSLDGVVKLDETYHPSPEGKVSVKLKNILENSVPCPGIAAVSMPLAKYTYSAGTIQGEFYCLPGGTGTDIPAESFLTWNWLTWQPQTRYTLYHSPHCLRYVALIECECKVKGYFSDGTNETVTIEALDPGNIYTIDTTFGTIRGLFSKQPTYYDFWIERSGVRQTWVQRYVLRDTLPGEPDFFVFQNSLGGFDTACFTGNRKEINELESMSGMFDDETFEFDIDRKKSWEKSTGYIEDENTRAWVLDFFNSSNRFHIVDGVLRRIVVSKPKLESMAGEPAGYEFTFMHSRQSKYISLPRTAVPELLEIISPTEELFFLAPRLNEFEKVDLWDGELLIPVQRPNSNKWLALPASLIKAVLDSYETIVSNLTKIFHPRGGAKELDITAKNLTAESITIEKQISSETFRQGFTGEGFAAWVDAAGSWMEIDNLTVRHRMSIYELTVQQIDYQGGIMICSPAAMKCVRVENYPTFYRCYFDTEEGQVQNQFQPDDQARCNRMSGEPKYYWRVVVATGENYIDIAKDGDDENGIPLVDGDDISEAGDIIVQMGNRKDPDRQNGHIITSVGPDSPRSEWYKGVDSFSLLGKVPNCIAPSGSKFTGMFVLSSGETVEQRMSSELLLRDALIASKVATTVYEAGIKVLENSIASKVSQTAYDANNNAVGSRISAVEQTASSWGVKITEAVNAIQIGGVNLVSGSYTGVGWTYSRFSGRTFELDNSGTVENYIYSPYFTPLPGEEITVSFWVKATANVSDAEIFILGNYYPTEGMMFHSIIPLTTEYRKIIFTATCPSTVVSNVRIRFDNNGSTDGQVSTLLVKDVKLERGNKATAWSPAPEDVAADIAAAQAAADSKVATTVYEAGIKVLENSIASKVSQTAYDANNNAVGNRISSVEQTASSWGGENH